MLFNGVDIRRDQFYTDKEYYSAIRAVLRR
jgi:hypothetical protein